MTQLEDRLLSPLSREYCAYFYYLTVFSLVAFIISFATIAYMVLSGELHFVPGILNLIFGFLMYFQNRLLYSMCVR
tara:strand:+ start:639 stop:866 length:228 start_codon:yes stop_codon:yes gene_type:complete